MQHSGNDRYRTSFLPTISIWCSISLCLYLHLAVSRCYHGSASGPEWNLETRRFIVVHLNNSSAIVQLFEVISGLYVELLYLCLITKVRTHTCIRYAAIYGSIECIHTHIYAHTQTTWMYPSSILASMSRRRSSFNSRSSLNMHTSCSTLRFPTRQCEETSRRFVIICRSEFLDDLITQYWFKIYLWGRRFIWYCSDAKEYCVFLGFVADTLLIPRPFDGDTKEWRTGHKYPIILHPERAKRWQVSLIHNSSIISILYAYLCLQCFYCESFVLWFIYLHFVTLSSLHRLPTLNIIF